MKKTRFYADRDSWTCFSDACNDVIVRIIIGERDRVHRMTIIKQDRYSCSLGLGEISAPRPGNPALPGEHHRLRCFFWAFPLKS